MRVFRHIVIFGTVVLIQTSAAASRGSAQDSGGASGRSGQSEASLAVGTPILAEINNSIDSKKAKSGDTISARTLDPVKSSDGRTILPRGTKITARLAQSMARSKGDGESIVGITFEKATLKDGSDVPLLVRAQAIAGPAAFASMTTPSADTSSLGTSQTSPMGNGGRMGPGSSQPPQGAPGAGPETATNSADLTPQSRGVIGLRGLKLGTTSADGKLVATIASDGKNVRLDSGTRFLLVIVPGERGDSEQPQ
jgi:hypothetical protein